MSDKNVVVAHVDEPVKDGHIGIFAMTGSGKGVLGQAQAGQHYLAKYKIIDFDLDRKENVFYGFKNRDKSMLGKLRECKRTPRGFPNTVYFPLTSKSGIVGAEYPENWKPFKICFEDLTAEELILMLDNPTESAKKVIYNLMYKNNEKTGKRKIRSVLDLLDRIVDIKNYHKTLFLVYEDVETGIITRKEISINSQTLAGLEGELVSLDAKDILEKKHGEYNLDIEKIMKDNKTISSFTFFSTKSFKEKVVCFSWICRKIMDLRKTKVQLSSGTYPKMFMRLAESHLFAPVDPKNTFDGYELAERVLLEIASEGRDVDIRLCLDTQGTTKLSRNVIFQIRLFFLGRMDKRNVNYFDSELYAIPGGRSQKEKITQQEVGTFTRIWKNAIEWRYPEFIAPAMNRCKAANENVLDVYRKELNYLGEKYKFYRLDYTPKIKVSFDIMDNHNETRVKQRPMFEQKTINMINELKKHPVEYIELKVFADKLGVSVGTTETYFYKEKVKEALAKTQYKKTTVDYTIYLYDAQKYLTKNKIKKKIQADADTLKRGKHPGKLQEKIGSF